MIHRERRKAGWRIAVAVVAVALLSCAVLIALDVRKVATEKRVERKFPRDKTLAKPAPTFPPLEKSDN
ncbi:MAG: hypothetical protein QOC70_1915 [Verrucomicrobiota bacterium]|jgi:hypothetical protein